MSSCEFDTLTPGPSPAKRERGDPQGQGEGSLRPRVSAIVRGAAREMRKQHTRSEGLLWSVLRGRRLAGRKFRRQHPVGRFILDFYCHEERLAVEVDGPVHEKHRQADVERQQTLESLGIRFLRLSAAVVEHDLPGALAAVEAALSPGPPPASRERGVRRGGRGEAA